MYSDCTYKWHFLCQTKTTQGQQFDKSVKTFYDQRRSIDNDAPSINGQHKLTETALLVSDGSKTKTSLWKIKQTLDEKKNNVGLMSAL